MAEFCLECWNRINCEENDKSMYIISKSLELCEGCGEYKPVIIMERSAYYIHNFEYIIFPFRIIYKVIYFIFSLILLPYFKIKNNKTKYKN